MGRKESNQRNKHFAITVIRPVKQFVSVKLRLYSHLSVKLCVLCAQKNRLNERVLLSTHNICYVWDIEKIIFSYALFFGPELYILALHC